MPTVRSGGDSKQRTAGRSAFQSRRLDAEKESAMATYIVLFKWTEQGIKNAKESVDRVQQAGSLFGPMGVTIRSIWWTQGKYDLVGVVEAPDDQSLAAALIKLGAAGNVRTQTLRAFNQ